MISATAYPQQWAEIICMAREIEVRLVDAVAASKRAVMRGTADAHHMSPSLLYGGTIRPARISGARYFGVPDADMARERQTEREDKREDLRHSASW